MLSRFTFTVKYIGDKHGGLQFADKSAYLPTFWNSHGGDLRAQNFNGILNTFIYPLYANKLLKMTYFKLLFFLSSSINHISTMLNVIPLFSSGCRNSSKKYYWTVNICQLATYVWSIGSVRVRRRSSVSITLLSIYRI